MFDQDVVIVGSGYGGSVVAARLAQGGQRVLVLERGERLETADLVQSDDLRDLERVLDVVITSSNVAFRAGKLVGGASINMDGAHFRVPSVSFEARDDTGRRYWPSGLTRSALDPYYDVAEEALSIRQFPWEEIPKPGGLFAKMLDLVGATCDRARLNYVDCHQCGFCTQGCIYGKKKDLLHNYIPAAEAAGAEFRARSEVSTVEPDGDGYRVTYTRDGESRSVTGQRCVVACGGIHTPALLLRSASLLPGLSDQVGENFNNNGEHAYLGILPPDFDDLDAYWCFKGMDNAGMMSYHWFDSHGFTLHPGGGIEPTVFAAAVAAADHPVLPARPWGMDFKRFVESVYPHRIIAFSVLGLADGHRAVTLDSDGQVDLVDRDATAFYAYLDQIEAVLDEVTEQTGVTLLPTVPREFAGTTSTHHLSSCRMAESAEHGVVDPDGQVFGHEGLYVCDGSTLPYALAVNPALTITALAERLGSHLLGEG